MKKYVRKTEAVSSSSPDATIKGYEYQFIWSARRALGLLVPGTGLQRVVVEGVHVSDQSSRASDFYGVDLSEYHGPGKEGSPPKIILWQMKHADRHPEVPWTIARLCEGRNGDAAASVLGRLGVSFQALRKQDAKTPIFIRIASNRPLAPKAVGFLQKIGTIARELREHGKTSLTKNVKRANLTCSEQDDLGRLLRATGLKGRLVVEFIASIDLDYFGGPGYAQLEADLRSDVRLFVDADEERAFDRLVNRIRKGAQNLQSQMLTVDAVLAALGSSKGSLLPAPSQISQPDPYVETGQSSELARQIVEALG